MKGDIVGRLNSMAITVNDLQPILYRARVVGGTVYLVKVNHVEIVNDLDINY